MKKFTPQILYEKESGVLSIDLKKAKSADSDIFGNVVVDYDKDGAAVRVNIYDFNFSDFKKGAGPLKQFSQHSAIPFMTK